MADRQTAAGVLGLIQGFVNTVDLQEGPEELSDPDALGAWLVAQRLMAPGNPVGPADLQHAIGVREAIRNIIGANSGGTIYPVALATLNQAASASRLRARFAADGRPRLEPEAGGVDGAMGRIVAAVFAAMADDGWTQLKLCASPTCRWAFFDKSRNHSSRWCDMSSCGNRQKAKRFRQRSKAADRH
ncbi:MAG TPA: CGNR zinc finger domain-containing protein [Candidatus Dormibacteraeota bacterium]